MGELGVVDAPAQVGESTVKETPEVVTQGTESVASENGERAGGEQSTAEGGQADGQSVRQRGPSKLDTIRELRLKLREQKSSYDSEFGTLRSQLDEMKAMIAQTRTGEKKPSKTFWEAPEEVNRSIIQEELKTLREELLQNFSKTRQVDQETTEWEQERSAAAKFIQGQRGVTPEDQEDIADVIRSTPSMMNLRPMERAEYALYLWQKQRGVTDKSVLKAKASTVVGAPSVGGGEKTWTEAEIEQRVNEFNRVPMAQWTPEQIQKFDLFEREIREAQRAGRVKK